MTSPNDVRSTDQVDLAGLMRQLYDRQIALSSGDGYLGEHGKPGVIANQIRTFHWYRPHLPASGDILDWGCNHAPDSCLLRAWFGDRYQLHNCDFVERERFAVFHDFARAAYTRLDDPVRLPYSPGSLDVVIASGVLEHVAMDYESLKELHRVLKPDGVLVISYLPNWLSVNEWRRRIIYKKDFHRRLYGKGEARQLLKRTGFYPVEFRYHTFLWERLVGAVGLGRWERPLGGLLSRIIPNRYFASTLCFIARKVVVF